MTKRDKAVMQHFNISPKDFYNKYAIVLDGDIDEIYADNLTIDEARFGVEIEQDWEGAHPNIMSMGLIYRLKYIAEIKRQNRVKCIADLRKIIAAGNVAKRLFRRNILQYNGKADKFLNDYQF